MTTNKPLAKALHTVTVVARIARSIQQEGRNVSDEYAARLALAMLGYESQQYDGSPLFAACVKAVQA